MVYFPTGFDEEEKKKKNIFQRFSEFVTGSEEVGQRMEERRSQGKELLPDVSNIRETTEKINKNLQNFADFYLNLGREPRNFVVDFFQNLFNIDKDKEKQGLQLVKPVHAADFPSTFEEEEKKKDT